MAEDSEEDIVLPNSPLANYVYQYLPENEVGTFVDVTCTISPTQTCKEKSQVANIEPTEKQKYTLADFLKFFLGAFLSFLRVNILLEYIAKNWFLKYIKEEQDSVILYEDRSFLLTLHSELKEKSQSTNTGMVNILWIKFIQVCFIMLVATFAIWLVFSRDLPFMYFAVIYFFAYGLFFIVFIGYFKMFSYVEKAYFCTKNTMFQLKRCIKLIQEAELIARGFTTASVTSAAERLEQSHGLPFYTVDRQHLELRRCVFTVLRTIFLEFRVKTLLLLEGVSVSPVDPLNARLSKSALEEFGGLMSYELQSPELENLTDTFSISSLKTMVKLVQKQVSEYFMFAGTACFYVAVGSVNQSSIEIFTSFWCLNSVAKHLYHILKPLEMRVEKSFVYYNCIERSLASIDGVQEPTRKNYSEIDVLITMVHSMNLHLKAAILRATELENELSGNWKDLHSFLEKMEGKMEVVLSEMDTSKECMEKSSAVLFKLLNPVQEALEKPTINYKGMDENYISQKTLPRCDIERNVEDEVFEDVILKKDETSHCASIQVCEEGKRNLELSSYLLKELKNVLVIKADECRSREQKALKKKYINAFETQNISAEHEAKVSLTVDKLQMTANNDNNPVCKIETEINHVEEKTVSLKTVSEKLDYLESQNISSENDSTCEQSAIYPTPSKDGSFASSIATLAALRQAKLGLASDEFFADGSDFSEDGQADSD